MKRISIKPDPRTDRQPLTRPAFGWSPARLCTVLLLAGLLAHCDAVQPVEDEEAEAAGADDGLAIVEGFDRRTDEIGSSKTGDRAHWADGYVWADQPASASYTPANSYAFNRAGGTIRITKPAGTTGKYNVRFTGLSSFLGATSTVHVTGYGGDASYCKPVEAKLTSDVVTVRCFDAGTKAPVNAYYSVLLTRNYTDLAYAFANNAAGNNYAPPAGTSWNPTGAIRVFKSGTGTYQVQFSGYGGTFTTSGGHVQVVSVGAEQKHCKGMGWGGSPDLTVYVQCFNKGGGAANSKFNVLVLEPATPLAFAWASAPSTASYSPSSFYSSNSGGGGVTITRSAIGTYNVTFGGFSSQILDGGDAQVTAYGGFDGANAQCKVGGWGSQSVGVGCFKPNGTRVDAYFTVLLGS